MKTFWKSGCLIVLSSVLLVSCHNNKKLLAENVNYLYVDYDMYTDNNLGTTFPGTISAQLFSGESIKLESNKGFNSSENLDARIKDEQLAVYFTLPDYKTSRIPVQLTFTDKDGVSVNSQDSVTINFRGNSQIWFEGLSGSRGQTGENGKTPLLFRDGQQGGQGGTGQDGSDGENLEIHCWQKSDTLFIHVLNTTRNTIWRTMMVGSKPIFYVDVNGGTGGAGGVGGDGGDGKNGTGGTKPQAPGRGGSGGAGGFGGRGGKGGNVTVYVHPSVTTIETQLSIDNSGGSGGSGGDGGKGGRSGTPASGQTAAVAGTTGASGPRGSYGVNGQTYKIVQEFDFTKLM